MFLSVLSQNEKEHFLFLAMCAAEANGVVDECEKEMLEAYCREMGINRPQDDKHPPLDDLLEWTAANVDDTKKRIFILELLGIVLSDEIYDEAEQAFMRKVAQKTGVPDSFVDNVHEQLKVYKRVFERLAQMVRQGC